MDLTMTTATKIDFLYLSEQDMIAAGVTDMPACVDTMEEMFALLHHGDYRMAGANNDSHGAMVMFPEESPFPDMPRAGADRRFMAMPAYLGGNFRKAGMKWYGSNMANRDKGLPRSILTFILNDPDTGARWPSCRPICSRPIARGPFRAWARAIWPARIRAWWALSAPA
jgi:ornithine cyclodeaminase